jgi:8-oxo-dGTP pyrophosphatase MutT (NUDIX family)
MSAGDEIVAVVDERNHFVGAVSRRETRSRNLPHRAAYVLVFNSLGELCVQRRTATKDIYPAYLDPVAGGVILAGESYEQGAVRELEEELGIRGIPLTPLFDFFFEDERTRVWGRAFSCVYDGEIVLQAEEVESVTFMAIEEILQRADREHFTPDGLDVVRRYLASAK